MTPDGSRAFVIDELGNSVAQIDTATRRVVGPQPSVGFFPLGAALTPQGLLVANEGLMTYDVLSSPATAPPFTRATGRSRRGFIAVAHSAQRGRFARTGARRVGSDGPHAGRHSNSGRGPPGSDRCTEGRLVCVRRDEQCRSHRDCVALGPQPRVVGGTELRLYDRGPYGTQPSALALTRDGKRLYVALAGIDAIAVIDTSDPLHPHRLGLIPTGWYPARCALERRSLAVSLPMPRAWPKTADFHGAQASIRRFPGPRRNGRCG